MTLLEPLSGLPTSIRNRSGSVFYSGTQAFSSPCDLYILGLNPGGCAERQADETIALDIADWSRRPGRWSRYLDESWNEASPGTIGMQPRMQHLFASLGLDLRAIPASNVVFVRTSNEAALRRERDILLPMCWRFHAAVIDILQVRTILCLGGTAGRWARKMLGAERLTASWSETNERGWKSQAHMALDGRAVITVPHPSRADWRNPQADPTELVRKVLCR